MATKKVAKKGAKKIRLAGRGKKEHPERQYWRERQAIERASYKGRRDDFVRYLVPHRFEGGPEADPRKLSRAKLGFPPSLNAPYLFELLGHVRQAPTSYSWGQLADGEDATKEISGAPSGGVARRVWQDATRRAVSWTNFFQQKALEWMLSSPGGVIVVDAPARPENLRGQPLTKAQAKELRLRPFLRFCPFGDVVDAGRGDYGFSYIVLTKSVDQRKWDGTGSIVDWLKIYALEDDGSTTVIELDERNRERNRQSLGKFVDAQGEPMLPVVSAVYGEDDKVPFIGEGLLISLADISVDLYNTFNEVRTRFRDAAISLLAYTGTDGDEVADAIEQGSMFADLGPQGKLDRVGAGSAEIAAGLTLVDATVRAWALAARRKSAEAMERAQASSGVALQAQFQLDSQPLLVEIAGALDNVETSVMRLVAQFANKEIKPEALEEIKVDRVKEFKPEDEASRISRIVSEFIDTAIPIAPTAQVSIARRWHEAAGIVDFEKDGEVIAEETKAELAKKARSAELAISNFPDVTGGADDDDDEDEGGDDE